MKFIKSWILNRLRFYFLMSLRLRANYRKNWKIGTLQKLGIHLGVIGIMVVCELLMVMADHAIAENPKQPQTKVIYFTFATRHEMTLGFTPSNQKLFSPRFVKTERRSVAKHQEFLTGNINSTCAAEWLVVLVDLSLIENKSLIQEIVGILSISGALLIASKNHQS